MLANNVDKTAATFPSQNQNGEPSFLQKIVAWIFPFSRNPGYPPNAELIGDSSHRITKYQRPYNPPRQHIPLSNALNVPQFNKPIPPFNAPITSYKPQNFEENAAACSPCNHIPWIPILPSSSGAGGSGSGIQSTEKPLKLQVSSSARPFSTTVDTIYGKYSATRPPANVPQWHRPFSGPLYLPPAFSSTTKDPPIKIISSIPVFFTTVTQKVGFSSTTRRPVAVTTINPFLVSTFEPYRGPSTLRIHKYLGEVHSIDNITFTTRKPPKQPVRVTSLEYLPPNKLLPLEDTYRPVFSRTLSPTTDTPEHTTPWRSSDDVRLYPVETQYSVQEPKPEVSKQVEVVTTIPEFTRLPPGTFEKVVNDLLNPAFSAKVTTTTQSPPRDPFKLLEHFQVFTRNDSLPWKTTPDQLKNLWTTSTTPKPDKPKKIQYIIPYSSKQQPSPFRANHIRKYEDPTESPEQDPQESNIVTTKITPSPVQKSTKYVAKILASSIKELLLKEQVNTSTENVPLDLSRTLQDRIDRWTEEQFANTIDLTKITSNPMLPSTKPIPQEYITTSPLFPKVTVATVPPPSTTTTKKSVTSPQSRHRLTETESLDYYLINRLKNNFNVAKAYAQNQNFQNSRLWKALQVSISPITKEKVYIVTPEKPVEEQTQATPRFSIRPSFRSNRQRQKENGEI